SLPAVKRGFCEASEIRRLHVSRCAGKERARRHCGSANADDNHRGIGVTYQSLALFDVLSVSAKRKHNLGRHANPRTRQKRKGPLSTGGYAGERRGCDHNGPTGEGVGGGCGQGNIPPGEWKLDES